eukprot:362044-Chlamydomonas_euryale.AAC.16
MLPSASPAASFPVGSPSPSCSSARQSPRGQRAVPTSTVVALASTALWQHPRPQHKGAHLRKPDLQQRMVSTWSRAFKCGSTESHPQLQKAGAKGQSKRCTWLAGPAHRRRHNAMAAFPAPTPRPRCLTPTCRNVQLRSSD